MFSSPSIFLDSPLLYQNVADSERAIEQGRGIVIDGRQCRTERAKAHRKIPNLKPLYQNLQLRTGSLYLSRITGGLITEQEAYEILKDFGPLEKVWIASPTDKEMYRLPDGIWIMWSYFQGARDAQNVREPSYHGAHRTYENRIGVQGPSEISTRGTIASREP